jgi:predicted Fe-Mo cluster-binding NifX family protein
MKIAVSAVGPNLDDEIDPRFGRAPYLQIVDPEGTLLEVIDNSANRNAMGGAGIQAGKSLADRKVDVLLTGRCGPNAVRALDAAGIRVVEDQSGTVREAVERFSRDEPAFDPSVGGGRADRRGGPGRGTGCRGGGGYGPVGGRRSGGGCRRGGGAGGGGREGRGRRWGSGESGRIE